MSQGKLKHFCQLAFLLVMVILAAGAVLTLSLQVISVKPAQKAVRTISQSQMAYLGRGVPATGYMSRFSSSDYLSDIIADGGGAHRWPTSKFPLKVFIADGSRVPGYRPSFRTIMAQAFQDWQTNTNGLVSWRQVTDPRQADIVALWTADVTAKQGGVEAGNTVTLTAVDPYTHNGIIQAAKISILTAMGGHSFNDTEMRKTTLHEVGHSLGLEGHSSTRSDIMYAAVNPAQAPYLRDRDVNTLQRLYASNAPSYSPPAVANIPRNYGFGNSNNAYGSSSPYEYGTPYSAPSTGSPLRDAAWAIGRQLLRQRLGY